ncbi:thiolase C-terminal domain-containing protein [Azospirillum doebereinerae]
MASAKGACIVGLGETAYYKRGAADRSELALSYEAIAAAAADAGVETWEIDGLASFSNDSSEPGLLQSALRMRHLRLASMVWGGGGGGSCGAVAMAAAAVESGLASMVAVYRGLKQGEGNRFGHYRPWSPHSHFIAPYGALTPAHGAAMMTRRYMHAYGLTERQLGAVAVTFREHARRNPKALMQKPLTIDDYLASRFIADPLRLLDCCLEADGACAVLVTTWERAMDLKRKPVRILAASQGSETQWGTGFLGANAMPDEIYATANAKSLGQDVFTKAGLSPADIDVAQIYDPFTSFVLFSLEDYGFCGRGESGAFVEGGGLSWPHGALPCNTSGGHLSEAYIHGMSLVIEGAKQMRGTSTAQVEGARTAFVCGGPAAMPTSALVLSL